MQRFDTMGSLLVDSVKITLKFRSYRLCDDDSETSMDVATALPLAADTARHRHPETAPANARAARREPDWRAGIPGG